MPTKSQKTINLALQGGGAHGAFAWGVLDGLLDDGRVNIEGICATSAGAMNACAFAFGKHQGGTEGARESLQNFWWKIHQKSKQYSPVQRTPWEKMFAAFNNWNMDQSSAFYWLDTLTRTFSPYQLNPFDINPLRDVLEECIDFSLLQRCDSTKLFISTTHVQSGKVRVFETEQLSIDVALASACLPFLFKAVEIDGEDYWDGGYMGNPALFPLFYETKSRDIMIVHINPIERDSTPKTAPEIMNRVNEISFNSSLLKEMRSVAFVKKLLEHDMLKDDYKKQFKDILMHSIRADQALKDLSVSSKFDTSWEFLTNLRDRGRESAAAWLDEHYNSLNKKDTVNLHDEFLHSVTKMFENKGKNKPSKLRQTVSRAFGGRPSE